MATVNETANSTAIYEGGIRSIAQTYGERELTKTCPDIVVYLDNSPYLPNKYVKDEQNNTNYTLVSFNDHISTFQATYDTENLIPSCSITLIVPAQDKHLYQSPGGNNLIESMMHVKVMAKGYYASAAGNTIYHRVFNGVVMHTSHTDNGSTLIISVQCMGVLQFLAHVYQDISPAAESNSTHPVNARTSRFFNLSPYNMLAAMFAEPITFDGFQLNSYFQHHTNAANDQFTQAIDMGYITKWNAILLGVVKDTRIFGNTLYRVGGQNPDGTKRNNIPINSDNLAKPSSVKGSASSDNVIAADTRAGTNSVYDPTTDPFLQKLQEYLPDFGAGDVALLNGHIVSRIDRIRTIVQILGYEGYQDIDGMVIFKPPLYNLDVTNIGTEKSPTGGNTPVDNITPETNPFIVHLSEIESESETEDSAAIKFTRINVQPNICTNGDNYGLDSSMNPVVSHTDIPKLTRFGLREQPANSLHWMLTQDMKLLYTYAVGELNRQNRGFRTYTITIPLRPELRLGFPMYIPHKDMYGYIKSVSINYQQGGAATMSVTLDTIRRRPMFLSEGVLTSQPNLVMKWTKVAVVASTGDATKDAIAIIASAPNRLPDGSLDGTVATLQLLPSDMPSSEQQSVSDYAMNQLGTSWETHADTADGCFRTQLDRITASDKITTGDSKTAGNNLVGNIGDPFFSKQNWVTTDPKNPKKIDDVYFNKIRSCQPFTDENGYEVVTPIPWGRWRSLKQAYYETHAGIILNELSGAPPANNSNSGGAAVLQGVSAFLFAGVSNPTSLDPSTSLGAAISKVSKVVVENTSVELDDSSPAVVASTGDATKDAIAIIASAPNRLPDGSLDGTVATLQLLPVNMFLTGG